MTEIWQTTLQSMKSNSAVMDVLPILEDEMAQKVLVAWPRITITRKPNSDPLPEDDNGVWRWLWRGVEFDANELASIAAIHVLMARQKVDQLRGNRLIFPDGTIAKMAEQLMTAKAAEAINRAVNTQRKTLNDARS
jgi:hypothetical protein